MKPNWIETRKGLERAEYNGLVINLFTQFAILWEIWKGTEKVAWGTATSPDEAKKNALWMADEMINYPRW